MVNVLFDDLYNPPINPKDLTPEDIKEIKRILLIGIIIIIIVTILYKYFNYI
jgi:uncharacterized protein YvpB